MPGTARKISRSEADQFEKHGIELWDYFGEDGPPEGEVLYLETEDGHAEEFYNEESAFFYYVVEGEGSFYLDREEVAVSPGDLVYAPAETRIYYVGAMKFLLFVTPPWTPEQEVHVRDIDLGDTGG
ncbi:MAG: cupin domain-containing protein [Candidatus Nanohaloarchaea archaeon]|nr:cupin domain-containing protein [Candidatus Nanohaloarchaea archaeon]